MQQWSSPHHDPELTVADLAITILVNCKDHLLYLLVGHLEGDIICFLEKKKHLKKSKKLQNIGKSGFIFIYLV